MRTNLKLLALAACALLLGACASTSKTSESTNAINPAEIAGVKESLVRAGFKPVEYAKQVYYCRPEQVTGTQFKRQLCFSEKQMQEQARYTQEVQQNMIRQRTNPGCPPQGCGG